MIKEKYAHIGEGVRYNTAIVSEVKFGCESPYRLAAARIHITP